MISDLFEINGSLMFFILLTFIETGFDAESIKWTNKHIFQTMNSFEFCFSKQYFQKNHLYNYYAKKRFCCEKFDITQFLDVIHNLSMENTDITTSNLWIVKGNKSRVTFWIWNKAEIQTFSKICRRVIFLESWNLY